MKEKKEQILKHTEVLKQFFGTLSEKKQNETIENLKKTYNTIETIGDEQLLDEYKKIMLLIINKNKNKDLKPYDEIINLLRNIEKIIEQKSDLDQNLQELLQSIKENEMQILPYTNEELEKVANTYVELINIIESTNNEKINQKFLGIKKMFTEKNNIDCTQAIKYIEAFEKSVEKNISLTELNSTTDKLNKNDEKAKVYETLENYKYAIMCKDKITIRNSQNDLIVIAYALSISNEEKMKINDILEQLARLFDKKDAATLTEEEIEQALKMLDELEHVIDEIKVEEESNKTDEKPIPEEIEDIKQEMDSILGVSLLNEIENIDVKDDKYAILTQDKKDQLFHLKVEIKAHQFSLNPNIEEIEKLRLEMYLILGNEMFDPYKTHKETITLLDKKQSERFNKLKEKYNEKIKEKILKRKENDNKKDNNKIETEFTDKEQKFINNDYFLDKKISKIREEMAILINGEKMEHTAYEGIENIDVDSKIKNENDKERFKELREELMPLLAKKAKRTNKKGKLVKFKKSAKDFYQKHKKAIWIATGIALFAVSIPHLIPSIMYLNSALWHTAVTSGVAANAGLPVLLHDVNMIFGSQIGASYATSSGVWTLANGAALNATVAEAGILATLGRVVTVAVPFVGAKIAIKNAVKLAKEKIQKRKEKIEKETPERKGHFFKNIKDYAKNKFNAIKDGAKNIKENITTKFNDTKENISTKYNELKENHETRREEKAYEKEKHFKNNTVLKMLKNAYDMGLIDEVQYVKYLESDPEERLEFIETKFREEKGRGSK